jgi:hypothetical protein
MSVLVSMGAGAFSPAHLDVMTGDNVVWHNGSTKTHNVLFDTEGFNSGRVSPGGGANHVFPTAGVYDYHCTIHTNMIGQVGVYPLVLEGPTGRVRRGTTIALHVRAPENAGEVTIEANTGAGYQPVAVAGPATGGAHEGHDEPGTVHANVVAGESATYRAVFSGGSSNEVSVEVTDAPDISARARHTRRGTLVTVRANPVTPGARVVLQADLRERFGWWPVKRARLDKRSRATLLVHGLGKARARVVLVGPDWATALNETRVFRLRG